MIKEARKAISNSSQESSIYIGCDSVRYKKNNQWYARYAVVIILHKDSCRGANVFRQVKTIRDYGQLRSRLMTEVQMSVEAFDGISDIVGNRHLEIHLDVNPDPKHGSNVVVSEARGWIKGLGLISKIKDESFAASTAADHCARGKMKLPVSPLATNQ